MNARRRMPSSGWNYAKFGFNSGIKAEMCGPRNGRH